MRPWYILILFVALTLILTCPMIANLNTHLAGSDNDVWINPWADWWLIKALGEGQDPYYTDYLFYPQGVSLAFHSFSPLNTLFVFVLQPFVGSLVAYNIVVLSAYVLSGYGMWRLASHLTGSEYAGLLAGIVFAFSPYHMIEGAHPVISSTQWMPFFMLYLIKLVQEGRARYGWSAGLFLGLTAASSLHLFTFSVLLALLYLLYTILFERDTRNLRVLKGLVFVGLASSVIVLPLLYPILRERVTGGVAYMAVGLDEGVGNHPWGFFIPSNHNPIWEWLLTRSGYAIRKSGERPPFIGYTVLVLSLHEVFVGKHKTRFWGGAALLFALLSLGPYVFLRDGRLIPIPWSAPIVALWRHPFRFNLLVSFAVSILAAYDLSGLLRRGYRGRRSDNGKQRRMLVTCIVIAIALVEYLTLPFPMTRVEISPFYRLLGEHEEEFAVLEIPIGRQESKFSMYYQTIHKKKMIGGVVSRTPVDAYDYIIQNPLLYATWEGDPRSLSSLDVTEGLAALADDDVRYVIIQKSLLHEDVLASWRAVLGSSPVYEDTLLLVYSTGHLP
jgi:hypothetical protein